MTGAELKAKREAAKLTQEQLADKLGFTGKYRALQISAFETGDRPIHARLEKMLDMLFTSMEYGWQGEEGTW